ncbi:MAG: glycosyltransferase family 4 protein [Flavobacteriales bacterium]|nr:glycosyltransferase family 4 protein [Flavobacteriales bacterium]
MKILYFTKYSRNAGSSRLRSYQYVPWLEEAGFQVEVSPLFNEQYLINLYAGTSTLKEAVKGYTKRLLMLFSAAKYDRIVIEKELFPYLPAFAERLLSLFRVKYIADYDDAIFHNYDLHPNPVIRGVLGKKIDRVMRYACTVVAGNSYLAARAKKAGAKKIEVIPTVIDLLRYPKLPAAEDQPVVLGWIGTKSTFEKHVVPVMGWLQNAVEENDIIFHLVGVQPDQDYGDRIRFLPWKEDTEVAMIQSFSIGIMPLQDSLWEQGKCSYKLIQYMACSKPVIASPVGMNKEVVKEGINGYTTTGESEWRAAVKLLVGDEKKRMAFGKAGRTMVEKKYALQVTAKQWIALLSKSK